MPCARCKGLAGCSNRFIPSCVYHWKELVGAAGLCAAGQTTTQVDATSVNDVCSVFSCPGPLECSSCAAPVFDLAQTHALGSALNLGTF